MRLPLLPWSCILFLLTGFSAISDPSHRSAKTSTGIPTKATLVTPRYAVIDLGANEYPTKITNSGEVLLAQAGIEDSSGSLEFPLTYNYFRWFNGTSTQLNSQSVSDYGITATDISEDGSVIGSETALLSNSETIYSDSGSTETSSTPIWIEELAKWPPSSPTPVILPAPLYTGTPSYPVTNISYYGNDQGLVIEPPETGPD